MAEFAQDDSISLRVRFDGPPPSPGGPDPGAVLAGTLTVTGQADLVVMKVADATALTGQDFWTTITVTNQGPNDAFNVVLDDALPAGFELAGYDNVDGILCTGAGSPAHLVCSIGPLAVGHFVIFGVHGLALAAGVYTDTATVTSDTGDPNPADNSASATTTVSPDVGLPIRVSPA